MKNRWKRIIYLIILFCFLATNTSLGIYANENIELTINVVMIDNYINNMEQSNVIISGSSYPNREVTILVKDKSNAIKEFVLQSDSDGNYITPEFDITEFSEGNIRVEAISTNVNNEEIRAYATQDPTTTYYNFSKPTYGIGEFVPVGRKAARFISVNDDYMTKLYTRVGIGNKTGRYDSNTKVKFVVWKDAEGRQEKRFGEVVWESEPIKVMDLELVNQNYMFSQVLGRPIIQKNYKYEKEFEKPIFLPKGKYLVGWQTIEGEACVVRNIWGIPNGSGRSYYWSGEVAVQSYRDNMYFNHDINTIPSQLETMKTLVIKDTQPPQPLTVNTIMDDNVINSFESGKVIIKGKTERNANVKLRLSDTEHNETEVTLKANNSGQYTTGALDLTEMVDGEITLRVHAYDTAGNETILSYENDDGSSRLFKDTMPPPEPILYTVMEDNIINSQETLNTIITGRAETSKRVIITISDGAHEIRREVNCSTEGDFIAENINLVDFEDGPISINIAAINQVGNINSINQNVEKNTRQISSVTIESIAGDSFVNAREVNDFSITGNGEPGNTVMVNFYGDATYLSDIEWTNTAYAYGDGIQRNKNIDGQSLQINGKSYNKGLSVSTRSHVDYQLNGVYNRFKAEIGFDDSEIGKTEGSVRFIVLGDGGELYNSGTISSSVLQDGIPIDVNITGVNELRLIVEDVSEPTQNGIRLYRSPNYRIPGFVKRYPQYRKRYVVDINENKENLSYISGINWNNRNASMEVLGNLTVQLFTEKNYTGESLTTSSSINNFAPTSIKKYSVSSLKIFPKWAIHTNWANARVLSFSNNTSTKVEIGKDGRFEIEHLSIESMEDGTIEGELISKNAAGNISKTYFSAVKDTVPPDMPTVNTVAGDNIIDENEINTLQISGAGTPGEKIIIRLQDLVGQEVSFETMTDSNTGNFNIDEVDLSALKNGLIQLQVIAVDEAGNTNSNLVQIQKDCLQIKINVNLADVVSDKIKTIETMKIVNGIPRRMAFAFSSNSDLNNYKVTINKEGTRQIGNQVQIFQVLGENRITRLTNKLDEIQTASLSNGSGSRLTFKINNLSQGSYVIILPFYETLSKQEIIENDTNGHGKYISIRIDFGEGDFQRDYQLEVVPLLNVD